MRLIAPSLLLIVCLSQVACVGKLQSQPPPPKWTVGFWFWNGSSDDGTPRPWVPDVLFVQAGGIDLQEWPKTTPQWTAWGKIPNHFAAAREYWLVFRCSAQRVPDSQIVPILKERIAAVLNDAGSRAIKVAGIQLDIDSPTTSLGQYAEFLHEVHKTLPPGVQLSITCLLDWFRDGTSIGNVIQEVDEFVPQFYDVDPSGQGAIAAKFDAARWGPIFNEYGKRFRIGISTFGRGRSLPRPDELRTPFHFPVFYADLTPLDLSLNPAFRLETGKDETGETELTFRAIRDVSIGWTEVKAGQTIQFVLPSPDVVRTAVRSARGIHGYCAGVVFFRWPTDNESTTLPPDQVMAAAGVGAAAPGPPDVHLVDGHCAAVKCVDVYLMNTPTLSPRQLLYRIRASPELEYFLPESRMPVRMTGPSELEVSIPPYCGRQRMFLGRAVSANGITFTVEEEK